MVLWAFHTAGFKHVRIHGVPVRWVGLFIAQLETVNPKLLNPEP